MIEIGKNEAAKVYDIVYRTMSLMSAEMRTYGRTIQQKVDCANAIAQLASALDTRPHVMFGDINTTDDGGEEG